MVWSKFMFDIFQFFLFLFEHCFHQTLILIEVFRGSSCEKTNLRILLHIQKLLKSRISLFFYNFKAFLGRFQASKSCFLHQNHDFCVNIMIFASKSRFWCQKHVFDTKITFLASKSCFLRQNHEKCAKITTNAQKSRKMHKNHVL